MPRPSPPTHRSKSCFSKLKGMNPPLKSFYTLEINSFVKFLLINNTRIWSLYYWFSQERTVKTFFLSRNESAKVVIFIDLALTVGNFGYQILQPNNFNNLINPSTTKVSPSICFILKGWGSYVPWQAKKGWEWGKRGHESWKYDNISFVFFTILHKQISSDFFALCPFLVRKLTVTKLSQEKTDQ